MEETQYTELLVGGACLGLLLGMLVTFTVGRRAGIRHHQLDPEGARRFTGAVEGAIFSLLALFIAFAFDGAADRFDVRRALITEEANAIDAAWKQLDLLNATDQSVMRDDFRAYLDARLAFYRVLPDADAAAPHLERAEQLETQMWTRAVAAVESAPAPAAARILLPSMNRVFDVSETRRMARMTHPPLAIYALMAVLALICSGLAGHHSSPSARHPLALPLLFAGVSALAIFVILDLEYPRAGFIRVDSADVLLQELRTRMS